MREREKNRERELERNTKREREGGKSAHFIFRRVKQTYVHTQEA